MKEIMSWTSKIKHILVLSLTCFILIGAMGYSVPLVVSAEDVQQDVLFTDIKGMDCEEAINILATLDLVKGYHDHTFKPKDAVTRSEFTVLITRILGIDTIVQEDTVTKFSDVDERTFWASGPINAATKLGIVKGYEDGRFGPDDEVTFEQAAKMLVNVLGFDIEAQQKGGYPMGYLIVASEKGITNKVDAALSQPANRGEVAQMIYNTLHVDRMKMVGVGSDLKYSVEKDRTLLTDKLKIVKESGVITATQDLSLGSDEEIKEGQIKIDSNIFKVGKTKAREYLGYRVDYYYIEDTTEETGTLLYVVPKKDMNKVIAIQAEDIEEATTRKKMVYWASKEEDEVKKLDISSTVDVIFNGEICKNVEDEDFKPVQGKVVLLDRDSDEVCDVVFITSYQTIIVDSVAPSTNKVYNKQSQFKSGFEDCNQYIFDLDDENKKIKFVKENKEIKLSELKEWDVLQIAESKEGKHVNVFVTRKNLIGEITETGEDEVTVNGKVYKISPVFNNILAVGDDFPIYLDIENKIAAANNENFVSNATKYGYLIKAQVKQGITKGADFKILTDTGEFKTFRGQEEIIYEDIKKSSKQLAQEITVPQVILYELNKDGELKTISKPSYYEIKGKTATPPNFAYQMEFRTGKLGLVWRNIAGNAIEDYIAYKMDKAVIFMNYDIAPSASDGEKYKVAKYSELVDGTTFGSVAMLDVEKMSMKAAEVKITSDIPFGAGLSLPLLVDRITQAVNKEGAQVQKLTGFYDTKMIELYGIDEETFAGVQSGDIINVIQNAKGQVTEVNRNIMRGAWTDKARVVTKSDGQSEFGSRIVYYDRGKVTEADQDTKSIEVESITKDTQNMDVISYNYYSAAASKIYVYDYKTSKVRKGTFEDVDRDSYVYIFTKWNAPVVLVVYHNKEQ